MKRDVSFLVLGFVLGLVFMGSVTSKTRGPVLRQSTAATPYAGLSKSFAPVLRATNVVPGMIYGESIVIPAPVDNFNPPKYRTDLIDFRHSL